MHLFLQVSWQQFCVRADVSVPSGQHSFWSTTVLFVVFVSNFCLIPHAFISGQLFSVPSAEAKLQAFLFAQKTRHMPFIGTLFKTRQPKYGNTRKPKDALCRPKATCNVIHTKAIVMLKLLSLETKGQRTSHTINANVELLQPSQLVTNIFMMALPLIWWVKSHTTNCTNIAGSKLANHMYMKRGSRIIKAVTMFAVIMLPSLITAQMLQPLLFCLERMCTSFTPVNLGMLMNMTSHLCSGGSLIVTMLTTNMLLLMYQRNMRAFCPQVIECSTTRVTHVWLLISVNWFHMQN